MKTAQTVTPKGQKKTQRKYYALYDNQTGDYMATGRNDRSKKQVKESLLSYLSVDHTISELRTLSEATADELASMYEFTIDEQHTPFDEDNLDY
jgi:hypothetical protein